MLVVLLNWLGLMIVVCFAAVRGGMLLDLGLRLFVASACFECFVLFCLC